MEILIVAVFCACFAVTSSAKRKNREAQEIVPIDTPVSRFDPELELPDQNIAELSTVRITDRSRKTKCLGVLLTRTVVSFPEVCWTPNSGMVAMITCISGMYFTARHIVLDREIIKDKKHYNGIRIVEVMLKYTIDEKCWPFEETRYTESVIKPVNGAYVLAIRESENPRENIVEKLKIKNSTDSWINLSDMDDCLPVRRFIEGEPIFCGTRIAGLYVTYNAIQNGLSSSFTRLHNYEWEDPEAETAIEVEALREITREQYGRSVRYKVQNYLPNLGKRG